MQKAINFNDVAIVYVKGSAYRIHFWYMSKDDAISIMNGRFVIFFLCIKHDWFSLLSKKQRCATK